jgi:putative oxidoreductase
VFSSPVLASSFFKVTGLNIGLLLLRVALGITMLAHGYNHWLGGGKIAGTARWFSSIGFKQPVLQAWLATFTELAAGVFLLLGLLTPLAAAGVVGVLGVAFLTVHRKNGFFIFRPGEGYEYVTNLMFVALALSAAGPGEWSLDKALSVHLSSWPGLAIAFIGGAGAALVVLAVFWRPAQ